MINKLIIRPETEKDFIDITGVNNLAFGQANEGLLVEKLRNTPDYIPELSLVAVYKSKIVSHILFYLIKINDGSRQYLSNIRQLLMRFKGLVILCLKKF